VTRRAPLALVSLLLAVLVAACGVPLDEGPREITQTTIAPTEDVPTTISGSGQREISVYFLRDDRLERQGYPIEGEPTLAQAIDFVLDPPAEGVSEGLRSSVPPGTVRRGVEVTDGVATIDLTSEINDVSGPTQKEAFAQIVFTTLAFEDITQVRFLVDGQVIDAPTDEGNLPLVSADDYDPPLNPR
jgi:spore germination protein GerM